MRNDREVSTAAKRAIAALPWQQTPRLRRGSSNDACLWHMQCFGGSPIPILLPQERCYSHRRLYLGPSFYDQIEVTRPDVDAIINLCECDDGWPLQTYDRRWPRGEGMFGYTWQQLDEDGAAVADLLRQDKRVLIHCMAGVNRSPTLTCAVLMHLEGITAEVALRRVSRFHMPTHPEDGHWLVLRQLEIVLRDGARQEQRKN